MVIKIVDYFFEPGRRELAVAVTDPDIRYEFTNHLGDLHNIFYPVVDKKYLTASRNFLYNGIANEFTVETVNLGINRLPVGRWSVDDAQITSAHQGEL